jgi:RNA polymerase sigma-70 factor (ECF subfamily)
MDRHPDPASAAPDGALVAAVLDRGDEAAFRALYRRHSPRLYQIVLRLLGGRVQDAEDAVQDTWIRAVQGLAGFRGEARFATWLTGIGLNVARARLRWRAARDETALEEGPELPAASAMPEGRIDLERAIALLPDGQREILVLHDVEGWTHEQIARSSRISEGTSKSQLHHARRRMRTLMRGHEREETHERDRADA